MADLQPSDTLLINRKGTDHSATVMSVAKDINISIGSSLDSVGDIDDVDVTGGDEDDVLSLNDKGVWVPRDLGDTFVTSDDAKVTYLGISDTANDSVNLGGAASTSYLLKADASGTYAQMDNKYQTITANKFIGNGAQITGVPLPDFTTLPELT